MKRNNEERPLSRIYVYSETNQRVSLFVKRQNTRNQREAYEWLIDSVLDRDGKIRAHTKVNIPISMETFKKLSQKAREHKVSERVLITAMVDLANRYSELFKESRLF